MVVFAHITGRASRALQQLASAKEEAGLRGLTSAGLSMGRLLLAYPVVVATDTVFDLRRGVHTRGDLRHEEDLAPHAVGHDPVNYVPVDLRMWKKLHATLSIDRAATTFVDLGAGRGRAVLLAGELGFGRVIGVELDEDLAREADDNVHRWRPRHRTSIPPGQEITIVHGDCATYRLPDGPLVLSMFNPFGPTTLRHVLTQLCQTPRAPVHLTYFNPVHEAVLGEFPRLRRHSRGSGWTVHMLDGNSTPSDRRAEAADGRG